MKSSQMSHFQQAEQVLNEMEKLLDKLVESAKSLLLLSRQVIEEDELLRLQQDQEELLEKILQKDEEFHALPTKIQEEMGSQRLKINEKIDQFQQLNGEFIQNINTSQGLIQFDQKALKKRKEK